MRPVPRRALKAAALAILLAWSSALVAQSAPHPPCAGPPQPSYTKGGEQPNFQVWEGTSLAAWIPPACTGWTHGASTLLIALAGTFRFAGSADALLTRFGAISAMRGIRYWSATAKEWRVLVTEAAALDKPDSNNRRSDFAAAEMKPGIDLFFAQHDSGSADEVIYRMRVREAGADRVVLELENVTAVHALLLTIFEPGGMKFLYFLERRAGENWGIYALLAANSWSAAGNKASFINRVAAFYRHFTGVPTDGAPPLAR